MDVSNLQKRQDKHWGKDKKARRHPDHPVVQAVFGPLADRIATVIDHPEKASVIDVGCGNGFLQWSLEPHFAHVTGLDYAQQMLAVNPCANKIRATGTHLPLADNSVDVVAASHLLHHLAPADRRRTLLEMQRVARQRVVVIEPNRNNPFMLGFSLLQPEERMALRFSPAYLRQLFLEAGLTEIHIHVRGWIVPNKAPAWWIPFGNVLEKSPLQKMGVDIYAIGNVPPE